MWGEEEFTNCVDVGSGGRSVEGVYARRLRIKHDHLRYQDRESNATIYTVIQYISDTNMTRCENNMMA